MSGLGFDLQKMLHRKGEFESARLDAFAFAVRARTMRGLADALDLDAADLVRRIASSDDEGIIEQLGAELGADRVNAAYNLARAQAERDAVAELGDPTPVRLG
jgi:DNA-binding Lrp family transcriptional regulator